MRWVAIAPVALFAALGGFFLSGLFRENPDALPSTRVGQTAPPLSVTALPGKTPLTPEMLADGEVKLVNFWASWCVPCRVEHPQLEHLAEELPVYGINYKDAPDAALAFLEELGDPFAAIGVDGDARTGIDWGLYGVPETFVVAGDGTVMLRFAGPITESVIADTLTPAIEAARAR
ncbi:DsbE family thiol:disulfide interchange protein [Jannaschia seohaensis]|uniref:Cytochrome c biogenesis protein CcmG, thiol:disulfide interchange protein DsbE n=1 Tax=Jannaschia seohaensis TaxID=475081 RepID=A0A2Y9B2A5_9RHOB|nr:DsbE family thiol:disulfide interchange protein [Jannaschia seohaensis]PWJ13344.1 cytochrome c biogenesis protein CcmG/thiol:disulfide interchange protein DsbE [Jannaschia seohaensis]SSA50670.1 cytochrome c biogenesis protein CcmG, thiol:disulfide interchange protein DsbE [Jannaschia seohaensis]